MDDKKNILQLRNYHLIKGKNNEKTPIYPITIPEAIKGLDTALGSSGVTRVDTLPEQGEDGKIYYDTTNSTYYQYTSKWGFSPLSVQTVRPGVNFDSEDAQTGVLYRSRESGRLIRLDFNELRECCDIVFVNEGESPQFEKDGDIYYYDSENGGVYWLTTLGERRRIGDHPIFPIDVIESSSGTLNARANKLYISTFAGTQVGQTVMKTLDIQLQDGPRGPYIIRFTAFSGIQVIIMCADGSTIYFSGEVPDYESGHTYEINILGSYANIYDVTPGDPTVPVAEQGGGR